MMSRLIIDAATSLDGFWADARGRSVLPVDRVRGHGLIRNCGAVVMSERSYRSAGALARSGETQPALFVVAEARPRDDLPGIRFVKTFAAAFAAAREAAGEKAVLVIGETSAVTAALRSGEADEMWLHVVSRTLGEGVPLFEEQARVDDYFVSEMETTSGAVRMHLERRLAPA